MEPHQQQDGAPSHSLPPAEPAPPGSRRSALRRAVPGGLAAAGAGVVALVALSAVWGGLFGFHPSATIYGTAPPGWQGAATTALFYLIFAGPPVALAGFVVGLVVGLVRATRLASPPGPRG
jgi:hypothetical protein